MLPIHWHSQIYTHAGIQKAALKLRICLITTIYLLFVVYFYHDRRAFHVCECLLCVLFGFLLLFTVYRPINGRRYTNYFIYVYYVEYLIDTQTVFGGIRLKLVWLARSYVSFAIDTRNKSGCVGRRSMVALCPDACTSLSLSLSKSIQIYSLVVYFGCVHVFQMQIYTSTLLQLIIYQALQTPSHY